MTLPHSGPLHFLWRICLAGNLAGVLLHRFVLQTAEVDAMMFSPSIHGISYGYAALLFSGIVMVSMRYIF